MKRFFTLALYCLCLASVYAQIDSEVEQKATVANGIYLFDKAELVVRHYTTEKIVEHQIIKDKAGIDARDFHLQNIFLEIELIDNQVKKCTLPDGQRYELDEMMQLQPALDEKAEIEVDIKNNSDKFLFLGKSLPTYNIDAKGDTVTITFVKYNFGQSNVKYTMVAELVVTMTKQEDK